MEEPGIVKKLNRKGTERRGVWFRLWNRTWRGEGVGADLGKGRTRSGLGGSLAERKAKSR